jgi:16S rRNA (adenine1518-N6/adenine1519-N6)-dimethyltransferase
VAVKKKSARRPHRPKLGQHFLHDGQVLDRIVDALAFSPGQLVIEVGPGRGALTRKLLAAGARVLAIELDSELAARVRAEFVDQPHFEVIANDILNVDLRSLTGGAPAVLAGNLPYYITSPIVRKTLAAGSCLERAVFLVQLETAERIAAQKGTSEYGYLSALTQLQAYPEVMFRVPPEAFQPPPRVQSAVIRLTPKPTAELDPGFVRFLEAAFRHRRKTLLNNLSAVFDKTTVGEQPEAGLRAQQLDVTELHALWVRLKQLATRTAP